MKSLFFLALASTASNVILSDDQFGRHLFQQGSRYSNNFYRRRYSPTSNSVLGVPPDTICSADSDCAGYPLAYCDGVCRCNQGALNAGSTCISSGNAVQPAGSCPPGQTYVTETGSCMTVQMPGEPCQYSQQCAAAETGAFCLRLKCQCIYGMRETGGGCTFIDNQCTKRGSIFISELGECRDVIPPGGRGCSHSLQCTSAYQESTCFLQTCTCPPTHPVAIDGTCGRNCSAGETYSGVTGQCLPTVQPGDQCLYSSQCHSIYPGMICERSRCRCPNGMVFSGSKCSQTCPTGFIINSRGICMPGCRTNQVEFEGECLDQAAPDSPCVVNAQCIGGASCQNGACTCPKAMVAQGNVCKHAESAPLESCAEGQLCTGGSFCSNGNCTCPVGRQIVNAQCVTPQTVPPNSPCNPSVSCGGGSVCLNSLCTCPTNQQIVDGRCQVPRSVNPGNPCPTGFERCLGQSTCTNGVCECPFGTYPSQSECLPIRSAQAGSPCNANIRCQGLSICVDGFCQCPSGLTIVDGECRAATQVAPGSSCANNEICAGGSVCIGQVCACPQGTQISDGICRRVVSASPGQSCSQNEICSGGSNCQNSVCVCPLGTVNFQGSCRSTGASLGQCDSQQQCSGGAYCDVSRNQCVCPDGTILVGSLCIHNQQLSTTLDTSCTYDADCQRERVCVMKKCQCMFGELSDGNCRNLWSQRKVLRSPSPQKNPMRLSEEKRKKIILPASRFVDSSALSETKPRKNHVDIGGNCLRVGIACGGGSICVAGHCVCPLGMTPSNNVCVQHRTALPGEACGNGEDCIGDSECDLTHRRCECVKETQMIIGKTCQERLRSHPGYPCSNNELCVGGSSCRNGRCSCAENEIEVNKQCVYRQLVAAGEICGNGEECGGGSECNYSLKKCTCKRGYQLLDGKCVYLTVVGPGDSCASNLVRCGGGSYCARGRCECSPATVPVGGKCTKQKQVPPGNVCTSTDTCTGKAVCRNGICQCLSGMVLRSGSCEVRRKVMPSETCQPGDECLGGSKCNGFICECPPGQIGRDGVCRPRQTRRPGQVCHPEDICVGLAYCLDGLCQCKAGERIKDGKCIRGKYIIAGGSCTAFDECQGGSVCIGDICSCPQGKTLIGQQCKEVRRVPPGQPCNQTFVCDFGSVCDEERQMCKCPDGAQNRSGRCLIVADRDRKVPIIVPVNHKRVSIPSPFSPSKTISTTIAPRGTTASNTLSCLHNSDCGRGAICRGGACVCLSNMIMKNGRCILIQPVSNRKRRLLKEPCVTDEQCAVQNSFCLPIGICGCQPGFRVFGSTQCIRRMEPLSAKSFSLPTTTMSTVSSPRSLSQRTSSTTSFTPIPSTTVSSTAPTTTVTIFPVKRTTIEKSVETAESYGSKPTEIVQRYVLPGEECNRQLECIVGSVCIEGICRCPPAFLLVNNMCIRRKTHIVVPPSSSCALGETCGGNSNCQGGICICIDEFTLFRGECRTLPEIHSLIERESFIRLTTVPVRNKFHSLKTTKAPTYSTSSFATITTTVELPTTTPLSTSTIVATTETSTTEAAITTTTEKSSIPSSTAQSAITSVIKETEGTTKAPKTSPPALPYIIDPFMPLPAVSTVLTPRPSSWFKIAKPGHSCDVMTFCTNCSICIDNSCQCPEGLELQGGKCLSPIDARTCIASNHCPSGAECVSGVCRCQPGLALSRFGFCIPLTYVDPGMSCLEGEKCRGGSDCRDGICECPDGMNIRDNRCVPFSRVKRRIAVDNILRKDDSEFSERMVNAENIMKQTVSARLPLGDRCSSLSSCANGGICSSGICQCREEMVQASSNCILKSTISSQIAKPGDRCQSGVFCDGGASCVSFQCMCPSGYSIVSRVCSPVLSKALESCNKGERCSHGSICIAGVCTCPKGFIAIEGNCISAGSSNVAKSPGINCALNPNVCTGGSYCIQNVCTCPVGTENIGGFCLPPTSGVVSYASPGGICVEGQIICTGNSVCANGFCVCPGGEQIRNDICVSIDSQADPGQMCEAGITVCTGNSLCQDGTCKCPEGQTSLNGQCALITIVNTTPNPSCTLQCPLNSYCFSGRCYCNQGYSLVNGQCVLTNSCPNPCMANSACQQGACVCNPGYNPSGNQCLPSYEPSPEVGLPGQQCDLRVGAMLCRNGALCVNQQCVCPTNMVVYQQSCVQYLSDSSPGQSCASPGIICRGGSSCSAGICRCSYGFYPNNGMCSPNFVFTFVANPTTTPTPYPFELRPGSPCDARCEYSPCLQRCGAGSQCVNGFCTCPVGSYEFDGLCVPLAIDPVTTFSPISTATYRTARPGDRCDISILCTGGSSCIVGTCTCDEGYTPNIDRTSCMLINMPQQQRSYPGESCSADSDCIGNSFCTSKVCSCMNDEVVRDRKCTRRRSNQIMYPGSPCTSSSSCQTGSHCVREYCICMPGYTTNSKGQCVPESLSDTKSALPGAFCVVGSHPCEGGSWCNDGNCLCPISTSNRGNGRCVNGENNRTSSNDVLLGQPCSLQTDCSTTLLHSTCINYRCRCDSAYEAKDGQCVLRSSSKKACASYRDCDSPRVCSSAGFCECPFTMTEIENGVCVYTNNEVPNGSWCDSVTVKCQSPSVCQNSVCSCPSDYILRDSLCIPRSNSLF
ncbi:unnamed protein product [Auanema sp. JU1783]|nr:unnamed protein product [Auanema sp. JU1783]